MPSFLKLLIDLAGLVFVFHRHFYLLNAFVITCMFYFFTKQGTLDRLFLQGSLLFDYGPNILIIKPNKRTFSTLLNHLRQSFKTICILETFVIGKILIIQILQTIIRKLSYLNCKNFYFFL